MLGIDTKETQTRNKENRLKKFWLTITSSAEDTAEYEALVQRIKSLINDIIERGN